METLKKISLLGSFLFLTLFSYGQEASIEFTGPAISPSGNYLLFAANPKNQFDLYSLNLKTNHVEQLTFHDANDWYGEWITDDFIYFQSTRDHKRCLYTLDLKTKEVTLLVDDNVNQLLHYNGKNGDIYYITFDTKLAPDNNYYPKMETSEIIKYHLKTKVKTPLTSNDYTDDAPHVSPDGKELVFQSGKNGNIDIFKMKTDGTKVIQLTTYNSFDGIPVWSPNGKKIAYSKRMNNTNYEIWVMDADGSNKKNLTNTEAMELYASWTPDGKHIAFSSWRDGSQQIYIMDADTGANQMCLTCELKL